MSKYNSKKIEYNGERFDSKKECERYLYLKEMEENGEIHNLKRQVPIILLEGYQLEGERKVQPIKYMCDFIYDDSNGTTHYEDCKGFRTEVYKLKKKMFESRYGVKLEES